MVLTNFCKEDYSLNAFIFSVGLPEAVKPPFVSNILPREQQLEKLAFI
jgi:hypothetical protein